MFDVNGKIALENNAKYLKFHRWKVDSSEEMANSGNYAGDAVHKVSWIIRESIWYIN